MYANNNPIRGKMNFSNASPVLNVEVMMSTFNAVINKEIPAAIFIKASDDSLLSVLDDNLGIKANKK